jgi:hypothetical protein
MLADTPIYRRNEQMGEFFVMFDKENIMRACQKFFKCGFQKNVNLFHDPEMQQTGVTMFESFISDANRGISPMKGYDDAKDGSWFGSFKVDNPDLWSRIKAGEFSGFSIEGMFGMEPTDPDADGDVDTAVNLTPEEQAKLIADIQGILSAKISDEAALNAIMAILESVEC